MMLQIVIGLIVVESSATLAGNGLRIGDGGHLKNVCPTFAKMPNRITTVEFTTVCPTIANTMLAAVFCHSYPCFLKNSFLNSATFPENLLSNQIACGAPSNV